MTLEGKGFFIWKVPSCESGNAQTIATIAKESQLSHVLIKIADTVYSYNIVNNVDLVLPVSQALHSHGIQVWGWHYVKGNDPIGEANKAIERVHDLNLDGYVIDAETEYKDPGKREAAKRFMDRLRQTLKDTPIALCSYRFPSYHPQLPWKEFLEQCDLNMPQVYWLMAHNAGEQLDRCVREFQAMTPYRPIVPVGAAYKEFGWLPTSAEILDFLQTAQSLNLKAANFYSWDSCRQNLPQIWSTIKDYQWQPGDTYGDLPTRIITALNTHNPDQIIQLYQQNAIHITATRNIRGLAAIRAWYQSLLTILLPNASFTLTGSTGTGNTRYFTWTATSPYGKIQNGNDTLGIINNRISYHYSFFTITR
jgi:hypothetical protein